MIEKFKAGIALGRKHFAKIAAKSERWKKRNVPVYIRSELLVPYYMVESNGYYELHIIQFPITASEKVKFIPFARSTINEQKEKST
jgi:hypothetical protein